MGIQGFHANLLDQRWQAETGRTVSFLPDPVKPEPPPERPAKQMNIDLNYCFTYNLPKF